MPSLPDLPPITEAELTRDFAAAEARTKAGPLLVLREGKPPLVLVAAADYARLKRRDRQVFAIEDMPEALVAAVERATKDDVH